MPSKIIHTAQLLFTFTLMYNAGLNTAQMEDFVAGVCKFGVDDMTLWRRLSYEQCLQECRSRDTCTSINVNQKAGICRLNFDKGIELQPCMLYTYSEKVAWKKKTICNDAICPSRNKIKSDIECPRLAPPDEGQLWGNGRLVGHQVAYACSSKGVWTGIRYRKCLPTGEWSGEPDDCSRPSTPKGRTVTATSNTYPNESTVSTEQSSTTHIPTLSEQSSTTQTPTPSEPITTTSNTPTKARTTVPQATRSPFGFRYHYNRPCADNSECPDSFDMECRLEKCQCRMPFVLGKSTLKCVPNCPGIRTDSRYGQTYQDYANHVLDPSTFTETKARMDLTAFTSVEVTLESAFQRCTTTIECRAMQVLEYSGQFDITYWFGEGDINISVSPDESAFLRLFVRDCSETSLGGKK